MREILFRGKRTDNGEWVEGFYLYTNENTQPVIIDMECCSNVIIPETIGQYTGLKDKNGVRIFEGDICSKYSNYLGKKCNYPIVFEDGMFFMKSGVEAGMPLCDICEKVEVIGNIHDNPELLERGEEE